MLHSLRILPLIYGKRPQNCIPPIRKPTTKSSKPPRYMRGRALLLCEVCIVYTSVYTIIGDSTMVYILDKSGRVERCASLLFSRIKLSSARWDDVHKHTPHTVVLGFDVIFVWSPKCILLSDTRNAEMPFAVDEFCSWLDCGCVYFLVFILRNGGKERRWAKYSDLRSGMGGCARKVEFLRLLHLV